MKKIIVLILLSFSTSSYSAETSYVREYTYKASDLDSRVTARSNALKLIKTGVLEEIVSFVTTDSEISQKTIGENFRSSFIHQASSKSGGFLKARVIKETWNGYELWMKAEIKADPEKVRKELKKSLSMIQPGTVKTTPTQAMPKQVIVPANTSSQNYSGYMLVAKFSQVFSLITPIRLRMMERYSNYGKWPTELEQIRMSEDDTSDGQYIDNLRLGSNGEIIVALNKEFGNNKILKLYPKSVLGGTNIRWKCNTNLPVQQINSLSNFNCKNDNNLVFK